MHTTLLSSAGSDRATAYNIGNKLVRHDGKLFAGWLDAPAIAGGPTRVQLGIFDLCTGRLERTELLGDAVDNHCGPALALDPGTRLHAMLGAHGGSLRHRWSDQPSATGSWSTPLGLGPEDTYPSLITDAAGTLHLAHREYGEHWQLWYRRKPVGRDWEPPRPLAVSPVPGYNHFMQSLSVGPGGALHLLFQFHYGAPNEPADQKGKYAVHLRSDDGGDTWSNEGRSCEFPLTIETIRPFCHRPGGGIRLSNHVVDSLDRPWIFLCLPDRPGGALMRRDASGWTSIDLATSLDQLNFTGGHGREVSLSRSPDGRIHLVAATTPDSGPSAWFDPRHELFHLVLTEDGKTVSFRKITETDPAGAQWLPALENWDWTRATTCCADGPWLMFTRGLNLGGIGGNNANSMQTEVHLLHLESSPANKPT